MPTDKGMVSLSVAKAATGIAGLDLLLQGGFPRGRITLVDGTPGAGKTILALQSLVYGVQNLGEPGIFVAFEESSDAIVGNALSFGWNLPALQKRKLFFLNAQPPFDVVQSGTFDLSGLLAALDVKIGQMKARRIVFDAIDVVLAMLQDSASERRELYRLRDWILDRRLSAIITSKSFAFGAGRKRSAFMQFMMDCAISLDHRVQRGISQRSLRVVKYRGSAFHENEMPYLIDSSGLKVAFTHPTQAVSAPVTHERLSTGVARLDTMLGGGIFRGASLLVTGAPGTAKTTLGGAFAEAACKRGERTLVISFDSRAAEMVRNLSSVGIRLDRFTGTRKREGLLRVHYVQSLEGSAETHLLKIRALAQEHAARCVVIDPVSALIRPGNEEQSEGVAKRLLDWAKADGITLFCTSLVDHSLPELEGSPIRISTIADAWIHLSYQIRSGERNRGLSIIKARGTMHSNQVRELVLSDSGITLADTYSSGGEVLMGTLRWERERADELSRQENERAEHDERLRLASEQAELTVRLNGLQQQLAAKRAQLDALERSRKDRRVTTVTTQEQRSLRRRADGKRSTTGKQVL